MLLEQLISDEYVRQRCQNAKVDSELSTWHWERLDCRMHYDAAGTRTAGHRHCEEIAEVGKFLYNSMFYFCRIIFIPALLRRRAIVSRKNSVRRLNGKQKESIGKKYQHVFDRKADLEIGSMGIVSAHMDRLLLKIILPISDERDRFAQRQRGMQNGFLYNKYRKS